MGSCVYLVAIADCWRPRDSHSQNAELTPFVAAMYDAREIAT
jgi:hypothetical protein